MKMSETKISNIVAEFDTDQEFVVSRAYADGDIDPLAGRLLRAATNQIEGLKGATLSRYAIWANTVRDNIMQADSEFENGNLDAARRLLRRAANSLSAFSEIQAHFDPMKIGKYPVKPDRMGS